jgi:hypothetical protein
MDVIKEMANRFSHSLEMHTNSLESFDGELNSKLLYINKTSEKLRYLSYLKAIVETEYQDHAKVCTNPTSCPHNRSYEIALYSINQQYDSYYETIGGIDTSEKPAMQFFKEGQYFDAFTAIKESIKEAKSSIILVDGYIDENTLAFFPGKEPSIKLTIVTKNRSVNESLNRAVELYNRQYGNLTLSISEKYHDRFLILDDKVFYHIGASIKDAGNKVFMFSKIEEEDIQSLIRNKLKAELENVLV